MQADPEYLFEHYRSLSDDALRAINRAELIEAAQKYYDAEVKRREFGRGPSARKTDIEADDKPTSPVLTASSRSPHVDSAFEVLQAAGIPCAVELRDTPREDPGTRPKTIWALLVPDQLYLQATNILERDISNKDTEASWIAHLERLSDLELLALNPEEVWCGLFDLVERVTRAYANEIARRRLGPASS